MLPATVETPRIRSAGFAKHAKISIIASSCPGKDIQDQTPIQYHTVHVEAAGGKARTADTRVTINPYRLGHFNKGSQEILNFRLGHQDAKHAPK
jgi:hypothetical protein